MWLQVERPDCVNQPTHNRIDPGEVLCRLGVHVFPLAALTNYGVTAGEGLPQVPEKTNSEIEFRSRGFSSRSRK